MTNVAYASANLTGHALAVCIENSFIHLVPCSYIMLRKASLRLRWSIQWASMDSESHSSMSAMTLSKG